MRAKKSKATQARPLEQARINLGTASNMLRKAKSLRDIKEDLLELIEDAERHIDWVAAGCPTHNKRPNVKPSEEFSKHN